jgi:antitoxin ParD1/3/4
MPTSVALGTHFEAFLKKQLASGRYNNASEVVRAGLRLLEDQQKENALKLSGLRAAIKAGLDSGAGAAAEEVFDRLESKYRAMARNERA